MKVLVSLIALLASFLPAVESRADIVIGFEDLILAPNSFYNGGPKANTNGWSSGGVYFGNGFDGFWNGFSYSNVVNINTPGFGNQYAAFAPGSTGAGAGGSRNYAVAYSGSQAFFNLPTNTLLTSVSLANTTFSALSMQNGDSIAKKFGGIAGIEPDFFRVSLSGFEGLNGVGASVGTVTVNLADFTFADDSQDYILSDWLNVDLRSIANARSVSLGFSSSDVGAFGINTPTYVAFDNLTITAVPEPSSLVMLGIAGTGVAWWRRRKHIQSSKALT